MPQTQGRGTAGLRGRQRGSWARAVQRSSTGFVAGCLDERREGTGERERKRERVTLKFTLKAETLGFW